MKSSRFIWRPSVRPAFPPFSGVAGATRAISGGIDALNLPHSPVPLTPRDEAIFLLHTAAEVEHALLVQYLYASFSVDPRHPDGAAWRETLLQIAREEMGHLLTVENILRALGGPLSWDREDYPFRSEFYPFPFTLEPLTKDSVAKYVAAEMPETPNPSDYPRMPEIMARLEAESEAGINRVGRLYTRLIEMFELELTEDQFDPDTIGYQPDPGVWQGADPTVGAIDPRSIIVVPIVGTPAQMRTKATEALRHIAEQGEGTSSQVQHSHFAIFYQLYANLPETNPRYGPVAVHPSLPVPSHPSTAPERLSLPEFESGRITDPTACKWAQLFNLRYRMLLTYLNHVLHVDQRTAPQDEVYLRQTAFYLMREFPQLANILASLPRQAPNLFLDGRFAVAGAPFELPYSLALPDRSVDRWRLQRDLVLTGQEQIVVLRENPPSPFAARVLESLARADSNRLHEIERRLPPPPAFPRIHFRGTFRTNVCTNNNGLPGLDTVQMTIDSQGKTDDEFRAWLLQTTPDAAGVPRLHGGWNPYGANDFRFDTVTVTAVEQADGTVITDPAIDPLVGATLDFRGIMVDVDPENVVDTQVFPRDLTLQSGSSKWVARPTVLHSRGLSFRRNATVRGSRGAGTLFHAVIRPAQLSLTGNLPDTMTELVSAGRAGGTRFEFATYLAAPAKSEAELALEFAAGQTPSNPAIGTIIGTLAPWSGADLTSVPAGRRLNPVNPQPNPPAAIAPAYAIFDPLRNRIDLNFLHTVPEADSTGAKIDIGPLVLRLQSAAGFQDIGVVPYDQLSYELTAGIASIPVSTEMVSQLENGSLEVVATNSNTVVLSEVDWTFETDDRGVYLDVGESFSLRVRVNYRGRIPPVGSSCYISEYDRNQGAGNLFPATLVADQLLGLPSRVYTETDGWVDIPVTALKPGISRVGFQAAPGATTLDGTNGFYANFRIFPKDDYSNLTEAEVTFPKVYTEVLRFYHLLYPSMTNIFSLADETALKDNAAGILQRIGVHATNSPEYMPRTRELSSGKRALLARWCRKVLGRVGESPPPPPTPPTPITLAEAIEQMRNLIAFLKGPPHNAAGRHGGVDLPSGETLQDRFADSDGLIEYLRTGLGINNESGVPLVIPRDPAGSAFYRLITGGISSMTTKFDLVVPTVGKKGVIIVEEWINALPSPS